jgi:hypothetical protein
MEPIIVNNKVDNNNTTTHKLNAFLSRPLRDCALCDVPGVGAVALSKLAAAPERIGTAEQLLGYFMTNGQENTMRWMRIDCGIRTQEAKRITDALASKSARLSYV